MADVAPSTPAGGEGAQAGGARSRWMAHVKKTMRANKGKSLSQVLKMAKKTYKKTRKTRRGGADEEAPMMGGATLSPAAVGGRRRRSKKGSRKH